MKKLLRMLLCLIACMAGAAHADLTLEIVEMTRDPSTGAFTVVRSVNPASPGQFVLSATGVPTVLQLLNCAHPCTVYFPSGGTSPNLSVDTYKFSDTCSGAANPCTPASVARVVEAIIPGPHVAFKGLRITSLTGTADTWIGLIASTKAGDMGKLSKDGSYPAGGLLEGAFLDGSASPNPLITLGCPDPNFSSMGYNDLIHPCAQLLVEVDKIPMNEYGGLSIATVSIPCSNSTTGWNTSPCNIPYGKYEHKGAFNVLDEPRFTCKDALGCQPIHKNTLTAYFMTGNQILNLNNSAIGAMSQQREEDLGHEDLAHTLADAYGAPRWVSFNAATEPYRAIPRGLISFGTAHSFAFDLEQAAYRPAKDLKDGIALTSITTTPDGKNGDNHLPASERSRNDRSYASFVAKPGQLLWTGVHVVQLDYDFIANTTSSTDDPRLKELLFADCANNAFHVLILLEDKTGADAGQLKIRLGNSNEFKDGCAAAKLSGINLIDNSERRVESSKMPGKLLTIAESQKLFVGLYVRSISVVVGPGSPAKAENYKVKLLEANVNGVKATDSLLVIDPTSYRKLTKLPLTGRHVLISEQNKPLNTPVAELADDQIKNVENQFQAQLPKSLTPGVAYRVDLCLSGGRCVPLQGSFTLPKE